MDFQTAIKTCLSKFAAFNGRASRSEYWFFILFGFLAGMAIGVVDFVTSPKSEIHPLVALLVIVLLLPTLGVTIRRLHDTDTSGWWLAIFPLIIVVQNTILTEIPAAKGLLFLGAWVLFNFILASRGDKWANKYGEDPLTSSSPLDPQQKSPENEKLRRQTEISYLNDENEDVEADYNVIKDDWELTLKYYSDLPEIDLQLSKLSRQLSQTYKVFMIERKEFEDQEQRANSMYRKYMMKLLADKKELIRFTEYFKGNIFEERKQIANAMEYKYLLNHFGNDEGLKKFAMVLLLSGNMAAAKELNRAIKLFGSEINSTDIISTVAKEFELKYDPQV